MRTREWLPAVFGSFGARNIGVPSFPLRDRQQLSNILVPLSDCLHNALDSSRVERDDPATPGQRIRDPLLHRSRASRDRVNFGLLGCSQLNSLNTGTNVRPGSPRVHAIHPVQKTGATSLQRHGVARAIAREAELEGDVAIGHEHGIVHMKPRVGPGEHRFGVLALEEPAPHEEPEHGTAKGLGKRGGVVRRPRHEGAVGAEAAVGRCFQGSISCYQRQAVQSKPLHANSVTYHRRVSAFSRIWSTILFSHFPVEPQSQSERFLLDATYFQSACTEIVEWDESP